MTKPLNDPAEIAAIAKRLASLPPMCIVEGDRPRLPFLRLRLPDIYDAARPSYEVALLASEPRQPAFQALAAVADDLVYLLDSLASLRAEYLLTTLDAPRAGELRHDLGRAPGDEP